MAVRSETIVVRALSTLHNRMTSGFVCSQCRHNRGRAVEYLKVIVVLEYRLSTDPYELVVAYNGDPRLSTTHVNYFLQLSFRNTLHS